MKPYRITSPDDGTTWQATVRGVRQRPDFNSRGAAEAFATAVAAGKRKPEPTTTTTMTTKRLTLDDLSPDTRRIGKLFGVKV